MDMATTVLCLLVFVVIDTVKCDQSQFIVNLNNLLDANLGYFQLVLPPNKDFDGKLIFGEIDTPDVNCTRVYLKEMENFGRQGDFQQIVNLDTMVNNVTGTISVPKITLAIEKMDSPVYFGPLSPLTDVTISLSSAQFDLNFLMMPASDSQACNFILSAFIKINQVILHTNIPFANNRDITDFFNKSIIDYLNKNLSTLIVAVKYAKCDPYTTSELLVKAIHSLSNQTIDHFFSKS